MSILQSPRDCSMLMCSVEVNDFPLGFGMNGNVSACVCLCVFMYSFGFFLCVSVEVGPF